MPWQTIPGVTGKVYHPDVAGREKRYCCKDCFACQRCGQERCRVCRDEHGDTISACPPHKEVAT